MASGPGFKPTSTVAPAGGQAVYYRTDLSAATLGEIRRSAPGTFGFLAALLRKLLRRPTRPSGGWAVGQTTIVELNDLPDRVNELLAELLQACQRQGFVPRFGVTVPGIGDRESCGVVHSNKEGTILATVAFRRVADSRTLAANMHTMLRDGRIVCTTSAPACLNDPPEMQVKHHVGGSVPDLLRWHKLQLKELPDARPQPLDDLARRQFVLDLAERQLAFQRERGVWVPLTGDEVAQLRVY